MTRITLIVAALTLAACSKDGEDTGSGGASGGDATAGAAIYSSTCVGCHGADGQLGVDMGGTPSSDLTAVVPALSDAQITTAVQDGKGAMPAMGTSDADMPDLLAYLRATFP